MIPRPGDIIALPPMLRTIIYYVLGIALIVVSALVGAGILDPLYLAILANVSALFFGVAGSNVSTKVDKVATVEPIPVVVQQAPIQPVPVQQDAEQFPAA